MTTRTASPAAVIARLQRQLATQAAKLERAESAWQRGGVDAWRAHIAERYHHREAIANAARKHARMLGPTWLELLAARLVAVTPADHDGARLTEASAAKAVEAWARERRAAQAA